MCIVLEMIIIITFSARLQTESHGNERGEEREEEEEEEETMTKTIHVCLPRTQEDIIMDLRL